MRASAGWKAGGRRERLPHIGLAILLLPALAAQTPTFRLPDDVIPRKHSVELTVDPRQSTFEGSVRIEIQLRKPTSVIWVNAKGLTLKETSVTAPGAAPRFRVNTATSDFVGIELESPLPAGDAALSFRFQGKLDDKAVNGLYRRSIGDEWYAYTTFTPIEARRAFPCFDEPRFKTPWDISLRVRRDHRAFSNARAVSEREEPDGMKLVRFATTERLPAELVAVAVGPFEIVEGMPVNGTPVRAIVPRNRAADGTAAVEATAAVLPRLETYTGMEYPFGKIDHVALPDGTFSAVENPGLITYVIDGMLLPPDRATDKAKREIRDLQAHELAHQWFGNLVTQADWNDVWLSEGFATWLGEKVMDQEVRPERVHMDSIRSRERVMNFDLSRRTRPVRLEVTNEAGSRGIYSRVVYDKGAAILMMIEGWLGEAKFQQGVRSYLAAHKFGNATSDDLASALSEASGVDPKTVLHAFADTTGIPEVRGTVKCDRPQSSMLHIEQKGSTAIPVCWRTENGTSSCTVMTSASREIALPACPSWVYLNSGGTGYYRTTWSASSLNALRLAELTPAERLTLLYDLRAQKSDRNAVRMMLGKLVEDTEEDIAQAAREALK
jgi:cytosol alanyl aminopeptidase